MSRRKPHLTAPLAAAALLGAGLAVLPATSAGAATTTVRTEAQLRSALAAANRVDGEDTIRLGRSISLRRGQLEITDSLVLDGPATASSTSPVTSRCGSRTRPCAGGARPRGSRAVPSA